LETDENIKGDIIGYIRDLRFNQHKTIREIATITGKSSRDVIAVLKESVDKENKDTRSNIVETKNHEIESAEQEDPPPNIKAYQLFSEGKSLVEVTIALKLTAQQARQFYIEYWRLMQMHQLFTIYQENKDNIGYFLKLFRLSKKEGLTPEQVINLVKMADNLYKLKEVFRHLQSEVADIELRKSVSDEQLQALYNDIAIAKDNLSSANSGYKKKFAELSALYTQRQMLEYKIEQIKNSQDYKMIEQVAKEKVNELLADDRKLLEYALVSLIEALGSEPDSYLLLSKRPYKSLGLIPSILYEGDYQFVKEKVLESADKIFYRFQKGIVDSTLITAL
jgi:hypothetical protein